MNEFTAAALAYLKAHWHVGIAGTANAATDLGINPNTFKTRLARGQALVLRGPNGEQRSTLTFTGYHLIYNLLADRLLRYGFPIEQDERSLDHLCHSYSEWTFDKILSPPNNVDAIFRAWKLADGGVQHQPFKDGQVGDWTGDAALIIPIGTMVVRLAAALYMRSGDPDIFRQTTSS